MADISSRGDIELLIRTFYQRLFRVKGMPEIFSGLDLEAHIPRIVHFWSFVLLDEPGYKTNVFDKHLHLPISAPQFDEWLKEFTGAVDQLFSGEKAELAKQRATVLAFTFKSKWTALGRKS